MRAKDEAKELLILETALAMIARVGLSGLKMSELAKEAGLATGTVYIYFDNKEELIRKLYLFITRKSTTDLAAGIPGSLPLKAKIHALAHNYLQINLQNPEYDAFFEQYYRSPFFAETAEQLSEENSLMQPILNVVVQGQHEGLIKQADPDLLVMLVCGMISEAARQAHYARRTIPEEEWQVMFSVIWDGIKA